MPPTTTVASTVPPTEPPTPPPCEDEKCVQSWLKSFSVCRKCADFAEDYCGRDELFIKSCPKSCKVCMVMMTSRRTLANATQNGAGARLHTSTNTARQVLAIPEGWHADHR